MKRLVIAIAGSLLAASALAACAHGWGYGYDGPRYARDYERGYWMDRDMPMHRGMPGPGMMDGCPYDDHEYGSRMSGPGMWGPGMMMGPALDRLGLSAEQSQRAAEIQSELNRQLTAFDGQLVTEHGRLRELYAQPTFDRAKAADIQQRIVELRRQRAEAMRSAQVRIDALLSPDQRAQRRSDWGW